MSKIKAGRKKTPADIICSHAAILFREKGFKAASMRQLAENMGIEAPSLYNHISGKGELLEKICDCVAEKFMESIGEIELSHFNSRKKIEKLIRFHLRLMESMPAEVYVANNEWKHLGEQRKERFLQERKEYENRMANIVKEGIHAGEFRKTHPHIAVLVILSALRGFDFIRKYQSHLSNRVLENNIVNQLIKGIVN